MALSLRFTGASDGDDGPFSLAPAAAWASFGAWVEELSAVDTLRNLVLVGEAVDTAALREELETALERSPPSLLNVRRVAERLLSLVGVGDVEERAVVTDE